jgi:hypothetical protein
MEDKNTKPNGAKLKEQLHTAFLIVAIASFALGIAVNFYTLKRLKSGK